MDDEDNVTIFSEMEYGKEIKIKMLAQGLYKGVPFWVISRGTHPCAYVEATKFGKFDSKEIRCHGGITYDECFLDEVYDKESPGFVEGAGRFIGWDYAHGSDYFGAFEAIRCDGFRGKKWTVEEIIEDAHEVIDWLCDIPATESDDSSIPIEDRTELIKEFFTDIIRGAEDDIREEAFENIDDELLKKYNPINVAKLLNFDSFVDVIKIGVREKYGVELDFD